MDVDMLVRMAGCCPYVVATEWSGSHWAALGWSDQTTTGRAMDGPPRPFISSS